MRSSGQRVGYAAGAYDSFHIGRLNIVRGARSACDYLIAGVVSDDLTSAAEAKYPVVPLAERLKVVISIRYVDKAVAEDLPTKLKMGEQLHFDVIDKGDDCRGTAKGLKLEADFATVGVGVFDLRYTVRTWSTMRRSALHHPVARESATLDVAGPNLEVAR